MSQANIIEYMAKNTGWHSIAEVTKLVGPCRTKVAKDLRKLAHYGELEVRSTRDGQSSTKEYCVPGAPCVKT
jgi:predicted transcriptional regulator